MGKNKFSLRTRFAISTAKIINRIIKITGKGSGGTLPGFIARIIDPNILTTFSKTLDNKIIVTMGTNGKTTTNNIINKVLKYNGYNTVISPNGANMLNGIISSFILMTDKKNRLNADYATIEVDELASEIVFKYIKPKYIVITNISRDQLDRFGEIDIVISKIASAINKTSNSTVILNGDDPYSIILGSKFNNKKIYYGIKDSTNYDEKHLDTINTMFCPVCESKLKYRYIHYGSLGDYYCENNDFKRPDLNYNISDIIIDKNTEIKINNKTYIYNSDTLYNAYNILSAYAVINELKLINNNFNKAIFDYNFGNKREEKYIIKNTTVQIYLAKNPVSFKEKIKQVISDDKLKDVIININDTYQDGEDVSWLWDVDFERLDNNSTNKIYCSGLRRYDMGLRLKYDNVSCSFVYNLEYAIKTLINKGSENIHIIVNYSGLYPINSIINKILNEYNENKNITASESGIEDYFCEVSKTINSKSYNYKLNIAHICPDLLNLYGDRGNIRALINRANARRIDVNVNNININSDFDLNNSDILFIGGGSDREQKIVNDYLLLYKDSLKTYVENGGVILAVCGGFQLLGNYYETTTTKINGLGVINIYTKAKSKRLISNIILNNDTLGLIVGFENHAGRTFINNHSPLGDVKYGYGNNEKSKTEGVIYKNVFATYLHGPLLPKNPKLCDMILSKAINKKYNINKEFELLDDTLENLARQVIIDRFTNKLYILKQKIKEKI